MLVTAVKFAIPAAIIGFLLWNIDQHQWDALKTHDKNYPLLVSALVVAIGAMALSFARWCILVRCQGIELTMLEAQRLGSICFLLSFVSAGSVGGDLFKAIFLAKRRPGKRIEAVASVLVDRGAGLYGLLLLVAAALVFLEIPPDAEYMGQVTTGTLFLVGLGTVVLAILVFGGRMVDRMIQWGSTLPLIGGLIHKVGPPLRMFHHHPIAFGMSIVMSLGVQSMLVISMYFVARGLYPDPPTLIEHFVIVPVGMLMSALPLTPAGVGVLEATIDKLYKVVPMAKTSASGTLVALVFEMVKVVLGIIGTIFYWTANAEVMESLEEAEETLDVE
ncbi:MAG: flippase-like domain-containing protein [Pirellulaceae bacterium]|nr:flippase-like domain-containing protein [Pirellulaceae bacterium]